MTEFAKRLNNVLNDVGRYSCNGHLAAFEVMKQAWQMFKITNENPNSYWEIIL
jgi:hypothetical protein